MFQNAQKWFICPKRPCPIIDCLTDHLPDRFDSEVVLCSGGVWLGRQRIIDRGFMVEAGVTLTVYTSSFQGSSYRLDETRIVFEDSHILVVHKPACVSATSDRSHLYHNLTAGVAGYYQGQGIDYSPTAINRLDFMVEGLSLFAKHKSAERALFIAMQQRQIFKRYLAYLEPKEGLPDCIRLHDRVAFKGKTRVDEQGKKAHSLFMKYRETDRACIYSVILFTGRRHQIRFHAAHYLNPIIGDSLYGYSKKHEPIGLVADRLNFSLFKKRYRLSLETPDWVG